MKQPITEEQWRVMRGWCSLLVLNDCMHPEVHKRFRGPVGCKYETCPILAEMREKKGRDAKSRHRHEHGS